MQAQHCRITKKNTGQDKWTQYRVSMSKDSILGKGEAEKGQVIPASFLFESCNNSLRNEISFVLFSCQHTSASSGLGGPTVLWVPYASYRWNPKLQKTQSIHQHKARRNFHGLAYSWGMRECHRVQLQREYVTGAVWAHKAHIREPVHAFNSEPFITFNTKGSFL